MSLTHCAWLRRCASIAALFACCLLLAPLPADASPLNLNTNSPGDVSTFDMDVQYHAGTLTANSSGDGNLYNVLDDNGYFYPADFSLSATLDPATGALISGTITISGDEYYAPDGATLYSGVLLTGNLTAFGFPVGTDATNVALEFTFDVTGGALTAGAGVVTPTAPAGPYYNAATGGSIVHMVNDTSFFNGGWPASDFSGSTDASFSDTFPISYTPEPSTFVLFALGLLPFVCRRHRRGQQPA